MSWATKSNGKTATMWPIQTVIADRMNPGDTVMKGDRYAIAGIIDKKKGSYVRLELSLDDAKLVVEQLTAAIARVR